MPRMVQGRMRSVSIHAPARGATARWTRCGARSPRFDPRSRTGSDHGDRHPNQERTQFRSTLPHGERLRPDGERQSAPHVSIHAPARGATCDPSAEGEKPDVFRSTLPHGERLPSPVRQGFARRVSIHAPARGATDRPREEGSAPHVSIHAPARGATKPGSCALSGSRFRSTLPHGERRLHIANGPRQDAFRSTLPHGERPALAGGCAGAYGVSIHAPARGATRCRHIQARQDAVSIHAPARGATEDHFNHAFGAAVFRSTLPHGERRHGFGARTAVQAVSIHAPARGATR